VKWISLIERIFLLERVKSLVLERDGLVINVLIPDDLVPDDYDLRRRTNLSLLFQDGQISKQCFFLHTLCAPNHTGSERWTTKKISRKLAFARF
jgi:hypothetical protein